MKFKITSKYVAVHGRLYATVLARYGSLESCLNQAVQQWCDHNYNAGIGEVKNGEVYLSKTDTFMPADPALEGKRVIVMPLGMCEGEIISVVEDTK